MAVTGRRASQAPEKQPPTQTIRSPRVSGLSPAISVQTGQQRSVQELPLAAQGAAALQPGG